MGWRPHPRSFPASHSSGECPTWLGTCLQGRAANVAGENSAEKAGKKVSLTLPKKKSGNFLPSEWDLKLERRARNSEKQFGNGRGSGTVEFLIKTSRLDVLNEGNDETPMD
jgi:hypothetical protein